MSIFDAFKKTKLAPSSDSMSGPPNVRGPLSSCEAAKLVQLAAAERSSTPLLQRVQSGLSIRHDGRSHTWEFLLRFESLKCTAIFTVEPFDLEAEPDTPSLRLRQQFLPLQKHGSNPPSLPVPWSFTDSPAVVAALTRAGADFVAGPTDMAIFSHMHDPRTLSWRTHYFDRIVEVNDSDA